MGQVFWVVKCGERRAYSVEVNRFEKFEQVSALPFRRGDERDVGCQSLRAAEGRVAEGDFADDVATSALPAVNAFGYTLSTEVINAVMCANAYGYDYGSIGRQKSGSRTRPQFGYRQSIKVPW